MDDIVELTFNVLRKNEENSYQKYNCIQYVFYVHESDVKEKIEFVESLISKYKQILICMSTKYVWGVFEIATNNIIRNEFKLYLD